MVSTHTPIFDKTTLIVPADDVEIQRVETQYDEPSEVIYIQRVSQNYDSEKQLQDNKVYPAHMIIMSCEPDVAALDDLLQILIKESHNDQQVSLKQCLLKNNDKDSDLIHLNQVDLSLVVLKDDKLMPKDPYLHIDSHPSKKQKETLFHNVMPDECYQYVYYNDM